MSSPINKKILEHLAELARIDLSEKEQENLLKDLDGILEHFEELKSVDASSVFPMSGGTSLSNIIREDTSRQNTDKINPTESFPEEKGGYLKIPPVF